MHSNLARGLLRPNKGDIIKYLSDIPCEELLSLETDADEAREFIEQLHNGQVPSIIQDLPQEAAQEFIDVVNIALSLPTEIQDAAEAAVTDAANVSNDIEDGSIVQDIESIPGIILADVTSGWADFTNELTDAWNDATSGIGCCFGNSNDCPQSTTVGSCAAAAATTTTPGAAASTQNAAVASTQKTAAAATTSPDAAASTQGAIQSKTQSPAQPTGATSLASTQSLWAGLDFLIMMAVGVFACALHL